METAAAVVGLVGVAGIIVNVVTIGKELTAMIQSLTDARKEIAGRNAFMQALWARTQVQLETVHRILPILDDQHRRMQEETLRMLEVRLLSARNKVDRLRAAKRWRYVFSKSTLDEILQSMDSWQRMYDPSWYLIILMAKPTIDDALRRNAAGQAVEQANVLTTARRVRNAVRNDTSQSEHLSLSSAGRANFRSTSIPYASAKYMERPGKAGFIIDSIHVLPGSLVDDMERDIRKLASKLRNADPSEFGLLRCRGIDKVKNGAGELTSFDLVLDAQTTDSPRTLRSCLIQQTPHTLTERMELAKQLAKSVSYVHALEFVHKSIRPDNLIGFGDSKIVAFFLVGFEQVRSADGLSLLRGDADWERNIYRHPNRQGLTPGTKYTMQHDIYSLGVCLLEIGLWQSFVVYPEDGQVSSPNAALLPVLRRNLPVDNKGVLVDLARDQLPGRVGRLYAEVVVNCLTCLDEDNQDFGDESDLDNADETSVGIKYIENVLLRLESITL